MIEKMKFLSITGPKTDIDRVVNTYLSRYEIHLENALSELTTVENLSPFLEINPYREALNTINGFYEELEDPEKISPDRLKLEEALSIVRRVKEETQELADTRARLEEEFEHVTESLRIIRPFRNINYDLSSILKFRFIHYRFGRIEKEYARLEEEFEHVTESLRIIRPFRNINYDLSSILKFRFIHYRFGRIEKEYFEKFKNYIYDNLDTVFIKCEEDDEYIWGIYFMPHHEAHKVNAVYSSMHFERIFIPDEYNGTATEAFTELQKQYDSIQSQLEENKNASLKYLKDNSRDIVSAKEAISHLSRNFDVRKAAACTHGEKDNFYILCGWMTKKDSVSFLEDIKDSVSFLEDIKDDHKIFCLVEDEEGAEQVTGKAKTPPTKLKNPKLFKPFEMYVKMYGLPAYGEMDPTWFVAITYSFIFGAMFPPTKLKNPKLFKPFEMYVKMYGLPAYGEMDPTWFVAITYSFIFGAMFGDVGQGLLLAVGGFLLYKSKHIDLAGIISCAGIFSTFFGFMFGSIFGFEDVLPALWLHPMSNMMTVPFI